ncbi:hypothetical protein EIP86_000065 [Pleurotus ostreatoroseus]|nr:hypothetical protein EIP86_000065 [Pleurotus ostreatoroseus]
MLVSCSNTGNHTSPQPLDFTHRAPTSGLSGVAAGSANINPRVEDVETFSTPPSGTHWSLVYNHPERNLGTMTHQVNIPPSQGSSFSDASVGTTPTYMPPRLHRFDNTSSGVDLKQPSSWSSQPAFIPDPVGEYDITYRNGALPYHEVSQVAGTGWAQTMIPRFHRDNLWDLADTQDDWQQTNGLLSYTAAYLGPLEVGEFASPHWHAINVSAPGLPNDHEQSTLPSTVYHTTVEQRPSDGEKIPAGHPKDPPILMEFTRNGHPGVPLLDLQGIVGTFPMDDADDISLFRDHNISTKVQYQIYWPGYQPYKIQKYAQRIGPQGTKVYITRAQIAQQIAKMNKRVHAEGEYSKWRIGEGAIQPANIELIALKLYKKATLIPVFRYKS